MSRRQSYKWLQAKFALNADQAHIGKFSEYMCGEVILACGEALRNNHLLPTSHSKFRERNFNVRHDANDVNVDKEPPMPIASRSEFCTAKLCGRHDVSNVCADKEPPVAA